MNTLNNNYSKNIAILKENLRRGMDPDQADVAINAMEAQFRDNNLLDQEAQDYINEMRATVIEHFTHITIRSN